MVDEGLTQPAFADALDLSQGYISEVKNEKKSPSKQFINNVSHTFGVNKSWITGGVGPKYLESEPGKELEVLVGKGHPFNAIPLFSTALGLGWRTPPLNEMTENAPIIVHKSVLAGKRGPFIAARVVGDSMRPILESGDIVIIATEEKKILPGKIYAVRLDGELAVKKVSQLDKDTLIYSSFNEQEPLVKVNTKVEKHPIIGMVVGGWKSFNDVRG